MNEKSRKYPSVNPGSTMHIEDRIALSEVRGTINELLPEKCRECHNDTNSCFVCKSKDVKNESV